MTASNTAQTLELFTDFVCPWCYLGNAVLNQVAPSLSLTIRRTPFPLHPSTPPEGLLLSDMLRGMDLNAIHARLYTEMDKIGLPHGDRRYTYNSRLAQELALWADTQNDSHSLDPLLYQAYFVHDRNLADTKVLLAAVEEAGLDVAAAEEALAKRSFSDAVDAAWERARRFGITGIPTFVYGGYANSGYMPAQQLRDFIHFVQEKMAHPR